MEIKKRRTELAIVTLSILVLLALHSQGSKVIFNSNFVILIDVILLGLCVYLMPLLTHKRFVAMVDEIYVERNAHYIKRLLVYFFYLVLQSALIMKVLLVISFYISTDSFPGNILNAIFYFGELPPFLVIGIATNVFQHYKGVRYADE